MLLTLFFILQEVRRDAAFASVLLCSFSLWLYSNAGNGKRMLQKPQKQKNLDKIYQD